LADAFDPFHYERFPTQELILPGGTPCGGEQTVRVISTRKTWEELAPTLRATDEVRTEAVYEDLDLEELDPVAGFPLPSPSRLVTVSDRVQLPVIAAFRLLAARLKALGAANPILLKDCLEAPAGPLEAKRARLRSSIALGSLLADGIGDAILVRNEGGAANGVRLGYNILQAVGCRSFKTEYVACPSCGRTLFNLQTITALIKARTQHLKGVKIAIMGCIVNGPGEMADADFGYVGGAPGKVNLYVGKRAVKFNIPQVEAVERLIDLIREHEKWTEPEVCEVK
jgi:(E)-4-hydroxy-3-methylbut-2-enyl-diphosphate synthase